MLFNRPYSLLVCVCSLLLVAGVGCNSNSRSEADKIPEVNEVAELTPQQLSRFREQTGEVERLKAVGDFVKALELQQKLVNEVEQTVGSNDLNTAIQKMNLAWLYQETGDLKQAESLLLASHRTIQAKTEPSHRYRKIVVGNLIDLYLQKQEHGKVRQYEQMLKGNAGGEVALLTAAEEYEKTLAIADEAYTQAGKFAGNLPQMEAAWMTEKFQKHQTRDLRRSRVVIGGELNRKKANYERAMSKAHWYCMESLRIADANYDETDSRVTLVLQRIVERFQHFAPHDAEDAKIRLAKVRSRHTLNEQTKRGLPEFATLSAARKAIRAHLHSGSENFPYFTLMLKREPEITDAEIRRRVTIAWNDLQTAADLLEKYRNQAVSVTGWRQRQDWANEYWRAGIIFDRIERRIRDIANDPMQQRLERIDLLATIASDAGIAAADSAVTAGLILDAAVNQFDRQDFDRGKHLRPEQALKHLHWDYLEFLNFSRDWLQSAIYRYGTDEQKQLWQKAYDRVEPIRMAYRNQGVDRYLSTLYRVSRHHALDDFED